VYKRVYIGPFESHLIIKEEENRWLFSHPEVLLP